MLRRVFMHAATFLFGALQVFFRNDVLRGEERDYEI